MRNVSCDLMEKGSFLQHSRTICTQRWTKTNKPLGRGRKGASLSFPHTHTGKKGQVFVVSGPIHKKLSIQTKKKREEVKGCWWDQKTTQTSSNSKWGLEHARTNTAKGKRSKPTQWWEQEESEDYTENIHAGNRLGKSLRLQLRWKRDWKNTMKEGRYWGRGGKDRKIKGTWGVMNKHSKRNQVEPIFFLPVVLNWEWFCLSTKKRHL